MKKLVAAVAFLILAGCATSKPADIVFLEGHLDLQPVPGSRSMRAWASRPGALGDYHAFLFEPVVVILSNQAPDKQVSAEEMTELGAHLRDAFAAELRRGGYSVVDVPGAGVLRVRAALTELGPVDPTKNAAAKVVGAVIPGGVFLPTVDIGHAAIEVDMRDSQTNQRVAAFADRKAGRAYFNGLRPYHRWGDVENAFASWASEFRVRLDQIRAGK
ncbi:MAG TPA: DUF3313 domain-containing protein [Thermoanaerobaculia bacterium]|jgi:hypothetical protein|nr:DUF3313 domain-containing protein [Thermoanaerobaculia bacterium]